jgi:hypothetical protein
MALVPIWSVYWPNADRTGPDLEQMNRIVEVDEEVARMRAGNRYGDLPGDGTARWPTVKELAEYEAQQALEQKADEAQGDGDLTKLKKDELVALAEQHGVEVPSGATKADLAKLIEDARASEPVPAGSPAVESVESVAGETTGEPTGTAVE